MKPSILVIMRPNNFDLLKELHGINKFDLILTSPLDEKFRESRLACDSLSNYISREVDVKAIKDFSKILPQWEALQKNQGFQDEFTINGRNYFDNIRDNLDAMFRDQAPASIRLIEAFKNIYYQKNLCLVLVWTDVINRTKTLTRIAQKYGVKVLQVMHGSILGYKVGHSESEVYADRVAGFGLHHLDLLQTQSRLGGKIVLTGDPEKDQFFDGSVSYDKENICRELGLDPGSKIVFFGSTWTGPFSMRTFRNIQETTIKEFLKAFRKLQEEEPSLQLAIKLHPAEYGKSDLYRQYADEAGVENYRIFESHLYELLYICDVCTGFRSSIIINALIFGKPVLLFHFDEVSDHKFFEGLAIKWVFEPKDIYPNLKTYLYDEDTINAIKELIPKSVEYFNYKSDGKATQRVLDLICKMAEETLSSPVKEKITGPARAISTYDNRIFDHINFSGKKVLFVNSMKNMDLEELSRRRSDAKVVFLEDQGRDSIATDEDSVVTNSNSVASDSDSVENCVPTLEKGGEGGFEDLSSEPLENILYLDFKNDSIDKLGLEKESFDCIVFRKSLEALYDPWTWLRDVHEYVKPDGKILVEIVNIRNMNVLSSIINGYFTYSDEGILSFDNLRFFTPAELSVLAMSAGYELADVYHFLDESISEHPSVEPGHVYTLRGNNFILSNVPADSVTELYSSHSLFILKKLAPNNAFTSPLLLPKPEDYFENPRTDLVRMMDRAPETVLEIGCGIGTTCREIKSRYPGCRTIGIDIDEKSIQKAAAAVDMAVTADVEKTELSSLGVEDGSLDYILYGDVLEHFENPWEVLRNHKRYLKKDGKILASIPNVRHNSVLASMLYGRWTYAPSGILDVTHLRFFTLREIKRLFRSAGLYIYDVKGSPDLRPEDLKLSPEYSHFDFNIQDIRLQNIPREEVPEFSIIQFLIKAGKEGRELLK